MKVEIEVEDTLLAEAMAATGTSTAEAAVCLALRQLIQHRPPLLDLAGLIEFLEGFDHKALREVRSMP